MSNRQPISYLSSYSNCAFMQIPCPLLQLLRRIKCTMATSTHWGIEVSDAISIDMLALEYPVCRE